MSAERLSNFLTDIIDADLECGRHTSVVTRFPPEPNGYPHIGHAKSICLNYGLAQRYGGRFHLRYDDTNPVTEDEEFVDAIARDVCWLIGVDRLEHVFWASDYFEQMYGFALELIRRGLAYVDSQSPDQVRAGRGDFTTPGTPSPYRDRTVAENLDLIAQMRAGAFPEGAHVVRARIDMSSPNVLMRDPVLYRIKHARHHNTGDAWCIYPMYDFAHCLEDAIEHVTHSICTLEFENNRELYDWLLDHVTAPARPHQYEFARLNLDFTVVSKRKLKRLVTDGHVDGWDDPRMPTISGLRRRGVRASAIRAFCELVGVAKNNSVVDIGKLEFAIRDDLNDVAARALAVLDPLPVVLTNVAADVIEWIAAPLWPEEFGRAETRAVPFSGRILIERDDFSEHPPAGFKRLAPGRVVRLRYGRPIRCDEVVHGADGQVASLRCSVVDVAPGAPVIHWVDEATSVSAEVRLYDRLFAAPAPGDDPDVDFTAELNPRSLTLRSGARVEPWLAERAAGVLADRGIEPGLHVQLERLGYFVPDRSATSERLVFNRVVTLKDGWARAQDGAASEDELRVARARERAEQSARSVRRDPRDLSVERGAEVAARFGVLCAAGVEPELSLSIASDAAHAAFVCCVPGFETDANTIAKLFVNLIAPSWDAAPPYPPAVLGAIARDVAAGVLGGAAAKRAHAEACARGAYTSGAVVDTAADDLGRAAGEVICANPDAVAKWRAGKTQVLGFLLGQLMRAVGGRADADAAKAALSERLDAR